MKLTILLELLLILIIVAYGAYGKPLEESRGIKASVRQAVVTAAPVEVAPAKPTAVTDDDDDVDLLALIGADDGTQH